MTQLNEKKMQFLEQQTAHKLTGLDDFIKDEGTIARMESLKNKFPSEKKSELLAALDNHIKNMRSAVDTITTLNNVYLAAQPINKASSLDEAWNKLLEPRENSTIIGINTVAWGKKTMDSREQLLLELDTELIVRLCTDALKASFAWYRENLNTILASAEAKLDAADFAVANPFVAEEAVEKPKEPAAEPTVAAPAQEPEAATAAQPEQPEEMEMVIPAFSSFEALLKAAYTEVKTIRAADQELSSLEQLMERQANGLKYARNHFDGLESDLHTLEQSAALKAKDAARSPKKSTPKFIAISTKDANELPQDHPQKIIEGTTGIHVHEVTDVVGGQSQVRLPLHIHGKENIRDAYVKEVAARELPTKLKIALGEAAIAKNKAKAELDYTIAEMDRIRDQLDMHSNILYGTPYAESEDPEAGLTQSHVFDIDQAIEANRLFKDGVVRIRELQDFILKAHKDMKREFAAKWDKVDPNKKKLEEERNEFTKVTAEWEKLAEDLNNDISGILAQINPSQNPELAAIIDNLLQMTADEFETFKSTHSGAMYNGKTDHVLEMFIKLKAITSKEEGENLSTGAVLRKTPGWFDALEASHHTEAEEEQVQGEMLAIASPGFGDVKTEEEKKPELVTVTRADAAAVEPAVTLRNEVDDDESAAATSAKPAVGTPTRKGHARNDSTFTFKGDDEPAAASTPKRAAAAKAADELENLQILIGDLKSLFKPRKDGVKYSEEEYKAKLESLSGEYGIATSQISIGNGNNLLDVMVSSRNVGLVKHAIKEGWFTEQQIKHAAITASFIYDDADFHAMVEAIGKDIFKDKSVSPFVSVKRLKAEEIIGKNAKSNKVKQATPEDKALHQCDFFSEDTQWAVHKDAAASASESSMVGKSFVLVDSAAAADGDGEALDPLNSSTTTMLDGVPGGGHDEILGGSGDSTS